MAAKDTSTNNSPQTHAKKDSGDWGEQVAADYLIRLGCAIRDRQWRGDHFEIDIIAQKGTRIIFVEVKTRRAKDTDPVSAVDAAKRHRMIMAADGYLRGINIPVEYQFDIIAVVGTQKNYKVEHIPDAFFPSPRTRR